MIFGGRESKSESYSVYCAWMHVYTNHGCPFTRNSLFWKLLHRSHRSPSPYRMMMLLLFLFLFSVSSSVKVFGFEDDEHTNTHSKRIFLPQDHAFSYIIYGKFCLFEFMSAILYLNAGSFMFVFKQPRCSAFDEDQKQQITGVCIHIWETQWGEGRRRDERSL